MSSSTIPLTTEHDLYVAAISAQHRAETAMRVANVKRADQEVRPERFEEVYQQGVQALKLYLVGVAEAHGIDLQKQGAANRELGRAAHVLIRDGVPEHT